MILQRCDDNAHQGRGSWQVSCADAHPETQWLGPWCSHVLCHRNLAGSPYLFVPVQCFRNLYRHCMMSIVVFCQSYCQRKQSSSKQQKTCRTNIESSKYKKKGINIRKISLIFIIIRSVITDDIIAGRIWHPSHLSVIALPSSFPASTTCNHLAIFNPTTLKLSSSSVIIRGFFTQITKDIDVIFSAILILDYPSNISQSIIISVMTVVNPHQNFKYFFLQVRGRQPEPRGCRARFFRWQERSRAVCCFGVEVFLAFVEHPVRNLF